MIKVLTAAVIFIGGFPSLDNRGGFKSVTHVRTGYSILEAEEDVRLCHCVPMNSQESVGCFPHVRNKTVHILTCELNKDSTDLCKKSIKVDVGFALMCVKGR